MNLLQKIKNRLVNSPETIDPAAAYDLWASSYDIQTGNPLIYLDEVVFDELFAEANVEGKVIVDIGCGTGRHWGKILDKKPAELIGYDVSGEMLKLLRQKYPGAKTYQAHDNNLKESDTESCDLIISTLTIGYIDNLKKSLTEWNRILKKGGEIIITDFHPDSLRNGAKRSFKYKSRSLVIKSYIHTITELKTFAKAVNWDVIQVVEKKVDDTIRLFFEKQGLLDAYYNLLNEPLLYGCRARKSAI